MQLTENVQHVTKLIYHMALNKCGFHCTKKNGFKKWL